MPGLNDPLTTREIAVLRLLAKGLSAKMVSARLNLSIRTVHFHFANVKAKLGVRTIAEVMYVAGRDDLLGEYWMGEDVE